MRLFLLLAIFSATLLSGALYLEHSEGYIPCPLCYQQRHGHYLALALCGLAVILYPRFKRTLFAGTLISLGYALSIAAYHAGVEWGVFESPSSCGGNNLSSENLLDALETVRLVSCSEPALLILGLSLAAWNALLTGIVIMGSLYWVLRKSENTPL